MDQNLILGRGKVYFDLYAPGTQLLTGRRYIGNTPEFALDISTTQLAHYGMDQGLKVKDDNVILELDRKGTFKTDEISMDNMSLFLIGTKGTLIATATVGQTSTLTKPLLDRYYQVGLLPGNVTGARDLVNVTVTTAAATPVPLVLGVDYTISLGLGLLYTVPTSTLIVPGTTSLIVTYDTMAVSRDQLQTTAVAAVEGALSFVAYNPKGKQNDYFMPYVQLTPNGAFALKGDVWQEVSFNLEILLADPSMSHIYVDGRPYTPSGFTNIP